MKARIRRQYPQAATGVQFKDERQNAGLSRAQAAVMLHVTPRTIRNWEIPTANVPWLAYEIMRIHGCHELTVFKLASCTGDKLKA